MNRTLPPRPDRRSKHTWKRRCRYYYHRFWRMQGTPDEIALGLAIGVFSGMFPFFGLQIIIAVAIATILRANKIMAALGTWISNPFTYLPIYLLNFHVGQWLLGHSDNSGWAGELSSWQALLTLSSTVLTELLLGCLVMGSIVSILCYLIARSLLSHRRQRP